MTSIPQHRRQWLPSPTRRPQKTWTLALVLGLASSSLTRASSGPRQSLLPSYATLKGEATRRTPTLSAAWFAQPPVIDGHLDEWSGVRYTPLVTPRQANFDPEWTGPDDCCARLRVGWDADSLYVAVEVLDDELQSDNSPASDDAVEITLGGGASGAAGSRFFTARLPLELYETKQRQLLTRNGERFAPVYGTTGVTAESGGVYTAEMRIAWSLVSATPPRPGQSFSVEVTVMDADAVDGPRTTLRWSGTWREGAETGGRLVLSPPPAPRPGKTDLTTCSVLGVDRAWFFPGETGQVILCTGAPEVEPVAWRCWLVLPGAPPVQLQAQGEWRNKLLRGCAWECSFPRDARNGVLVAMPDQGQHERLVRMTGTAGELLTNVTRQYNRFHEWLLDVARSDLHGAKGAAAATYWWRHRDLERFVAGLKRPLGGWRTEQEQGDNWLPHGPHRPPGSMGLTPPTRRPNLPWLAAQLSRFEQGVKALLLQTDKEKPAFQPGTTVRAYLSPLDDSLQPYSVYTPPGYPSRRGGNGEDLSTGYPLVIKLHGLGGAYSTGDPPDGLLGCVVAWPDGRGNTDYKAWGELDVLRVLDEVLRDYFVDPNRVYLTGFSMGGTGTWQLGVHYPDRFAALAPFCGNADHRAWRSKFGWVDPNPGRLSRMKEYLESLESNTFFAESLKQLPVYCVHGAADDYVPVEHSRLIVGRLRELGYDVIYDEQPDAGHCSFSPGTEDKVYRWLLKQRRNPHPRHVVYKTAHLRHRGAYWVRIDEFLEPLRFTVIDAEVDESNQVWVSTDNVRRFTLTLKEPLIDPTAPLTLIIDGQAETLTRLPASGEVSRECRISPETRRRRWGPPAPPAGLRKRAGLEGPIEDAFLSRFLVVYGTQGDAAEDEADEEEALRLDDFWSRWAHAHCRVRADTEVTAEDVQDSNLILFGNARSNLWIQKINDALPVRFEDNGVVVGDRRFPGADVGLKVVYPNPLNPNRYVVVIGGVTWRGTLDANERFGNWFDWGLFDNRNWFDYGVFDRRTRNPESFLAVGFFDQQWQLAENTLWLGRDVDREKLLPRRAPAVTVDESSGRVVYLSDLKPVTAKLEKGALSVDRSFAGRTLHVGDTYYRKGLGVHPNAEVTYRLGGKFHVFSAWVGPDLEGKKTVPRARADVEKVTFEVYGDGDLLARTKTMRWDSKPALICLDISGVRELRLVCTRHDAKRWLFGDWDWADAKVIRHALLEPPAFPPTDSVDVLDLSGAWSLQSFPPGEGIPAHAHSETPQDSGAAADPSDSSGYSAAYDYTGYGSTEGTHSPVKLTANVPGTVQQALHQAQKLSCPYQGKKAEDAAWVAGQEWWYRRSFDAPAQWKGRRVVLELDGVNYTADVWLNGTPLGSLEGMWTRGRIDVSRSLKYGDSNLLAIRVCAGRTAWTHPPNGIQPPKPEADLSWKLTRGLKGTPPLVPLGIWRPIRLRTTGAVSARDLVVTTTSVTSAKAMVRVQVTLTNHSAEPRSVKVIGTLREDEGVETPIPFGDPLVVPPNATKLLTTDVTIAHPHLWQPHELGEPGLYSAEVQVRYQSGGVSDETGTRFGIRTASVAPDGHLVVNGRDLRRVRGAIWLPADLLLNLPPARYAHFVRLARAAGIQVLRVWAGGLLETTDFYDACDRAGMLVIQDFPVLRSPPAQTVRERFLRIAGSNIRRLRSHPSLLAWCGGADLDLAAPRTASMVTALRKLCAALDPDRPFLPQLPSTGTWTSAEASGSVQQAGPAGAWTFLSVPLMSPSRQTMDRYVKPGDYDTKADVWSAHGATPEALAVNPFRADLDSGGAQDTSASSDDGSYSNVDQSVSSPDDSAVDLVRRLAVQQFLRTRLLVAQPWGRREQARFLWQAASPWPQFSPAFADWSGLARPALSVLQAWRRPTAVFGQVTPTVSPTGRPLRVAAVCRTARPALSGTVHQEILTPAGEVLARHEAPVNVQRGNNQLLPAWTWTVPSHEGDRVLFLRTRLVDSRGDDQAVDLVPFAARRMSHSSARLTVLWLSRSVEPLQPLFDFLQSVGVSVDLCDPDTVDSRTLEDAPVIVADVAAASHLLPQVLSRCRAGQGLLLYGTSPPVTGQVAETLSRIVPFTLARRQESAPPSPAHVVDPTHPVFAGLTDVPFPPADTPVTLAPLPGSQPLLSVGDNRAVLLESQVGGGRCLFLAADFSTGWGQQLRVGWQGFRPFMVNLLAYTAALPHPQVRRLREAVAAATPWRPFATLPQTQLAAAASTDALALKAGESASFVVTVANTGNAAATFVTLDFKSLSADALVRVGDNWFCLLPGETRKVPVRITVLSSVSDPTKTELVIDGFNCGPPVTLATVQIGEPKPAPAPATPSPSPDTQYQEDWQGPDYQGRYGADGMDKGMGPSRYDGAEPVTPDASLSP